MKSIPMSVLLVEGSLAKVSSRVSVTAYGTEGAVPIPSGGVVYLGFMQ